MYTIEANELCYRMAAEKHKNQCDIKLKVLPYNEQDYDNIFNELKSHLEFIWKGKPFHDFRSYLPRIAALAKRIIVSKMPPYPNEQRNILLQRDKINYWDYFAEKINIPTNNGNLSMLPKIKYIQKVTNYPWICRICKNIFTNERSINNFLQHICLNGHEVINSDKESINSSAYKVVLLDEQTLTIGQVKAKEEFFKDDSNVFISGTTFNIFFLHFYYINLIKYI
jgi:hypothetical protein